MTANSKAISVWTLFRRDAGFVAQRLSIIDGEVFPTRDKLPSASLATLRKRLEARGLNTVSRMADDDSAVIEQWI
jgi:hypothetical protein